jgi:hypothetical protein
MGPILTRLLGTHNHHDRLAELLPKLSKLQLVSDLQTPLGDPSRQPSDEQCWSLLSLPAQHICQTVHESRKFSKVVRPLPSSITLHHYAGDSRKASLIVPNIDFANDPEGSVCDISTVFTRPICNLPSFIIQLAFHFEWDTVRASVNEQLGSSILAQTTRSHLDRLKFKMYGMFFPNFGHQIICQCGDEVEHTHRVVNEVAFYIFKSRGGGNRIPYDVEFGPIEQAPAFMACGEK